MTTLRMTHVSSSSVELRCPVGPRRLLAKMLQRGQVPAVAEGNLLEFACADCRRLRRQEGEGVALVLHRFNLAGDLIESVVVPS